MDIEHDPDIRIERDGTAVRQVLHPAKPFLHDSAASPEDLAALYLHVHARLFGIDRSSLPAVAGMPPLSFRTWLVKLLCSLPLVGRCLCCLLVDGARVDHAPGSITVRDGESVAVIFRQVHCVRVGLSTRDLPVRGSGIRVMVGLSPLHVTGAYSTLRPDLPSVIRSLPFSTAIGEVAARFDVPLGAVEGFFLDEPPAIAGTPPAQPLAPVLVFGSTEYPGAVGATPGPRLPYRWFVDPVSGTVIRREVLVSNVTGLVFPVDPCSRNPLAAPIPAPYRPEGQLDWYRRARSLGYLTAPPLGQPQELRGPRVYVAPDNPLGIAPPTRPVGANFDFPSRSNHFAAVSAYYHCDGAFRMIEALDYPPATYFAENVKANKYPIRVVHRAPMPPGPAVFDGRAVNAHVVQGHIQSTPNVSAPNVVEEISFALGDLSDLPDAPDWIIALGIAPDARFVWHEFCHALLIAATGCLEFPFAHSAGDALAAIICDLDSRIGQLAPPWRGVTFPWVEALRRHDRRVDQSWGWHGPLYSPIRDIRDPAGYRGEQILSSTLFRLYRALGGDAVLGGNTPDLGARRAAAAYTVYLIVRAIKSLGPCSVTPALDAYALAGALMLADQDRTVLQPDAIVFPPFLSDARRAGAVHKVVRWSFERQGLWAAPGGPGNVPGRPEVVDVYIDDADARQGEYGYTAKWYAEKTDLWVTAQPNSGDPDATPHVNTASYVFVRVQNRGTGPSAPTATVKVFAAKGPLANPPRWYLAPGPPNKWIELAPHAGAVTTAVVAPGGSVDFGPFRWIPSTPGGYGLLACVDAPGDLCNAFVPAYACAVGPTRLAHLVPFDNNIGYRHVSVLA